MAVLDDDLAENISKLRAHDADDADVEAKRAERKLPKGVRATLSAFANTAGSVLILGLDEQRGCEQQHPRQPLLPLGKSSHPGAINGVRVFASWTGHKVV